MKTHTSKKAPPRLVAATILTDWIKTGDFPDRMLAPIRQDRALIVEMVYGVVRWQRALDWIMMSMLRTPPAPDVKAFLWLGLYQLLFMEHLAEYAALNETVESVKKVCGIRSANLVNAILRRVQRERDQIQLKLSKQPLGVRCSHPDELIGRWAKRWSKEQLNALCEWNNSRSRVVIRLTGVSSEKYLEMLKTAGQEAEAHPYRPKDCLVLSPGARVEELPGFKEGAFIVQDPATLTAPELLDPQPGQDLLDACAAPGGKLLVLADLMGNRGCLVGLDLHEDRLSRLRENLQRTKKESIRILRADASKADNMHAALKKAGLPEMFDRILLDVPCTNTGVLRRRVDARWRFTAERLEKMTWIQTEILTAASSFLKPGGALVYSTCSLEWEENEGLVQAWLKTHPDFEMETSRFLFPPETGTDGAFAARIIRKTPV
jgi:16S rRNA (cytosine967-C5)-methyltransferase